MKIAIVTGASSGLGSEFVRQIEDLYVALDEIWVLARRGDKMAAIQRELKTPLRIFALDLENTDSFATIKQVLEKEKPNIRMLVNAAGFGKIGCANTLSTQEQIGMIDVNCKALTQMTLLCLPYMQKESYLIQIASAAAFCPQPEFSIYAATKSYVLSFSRSLGVELASRNIHVTAVCPGPVDTEFFQVAGTSHHLDFLKKAAMAQPKQVVHRALLDAVHGKSLSMYGWMIKGAYAATKILPHHWLLHMMSYM
ncbi:MAG: SDR family NAD(P)-dependent oxidoreductase [Lachnospiraceae bacterium]